METSANLFLVRHGEAEHNIARILNSFPENKRYHLTERGKKQAEAAGETLSREKIDVIVSSPILRARETAEIIAEAIRVPVIFDDRLRETDFGSFNEASVSELWKKYPNSSSRIDIFSEDGLESFRKQENRLRDFLLDCRDRYSGKKVAVVSHGDPLRILYGLLQGASLEDSVIGWSPALGSVTGVRG